MTQVQTIGKEAPHYLDNEDAWHINEHRGLWAIADGAGGTGIYAGEWAWFLAANAPVVPFRGVDGLTSWLDGCWGEFFRQYQPRAARHFLTERKFMDEGSGATLALLHQVGAHMHWCVYGDAVALCFNPETGTLQVAKPGLSQFETAPHLLNWNCAPQPAGFACGLWVHEPHNRYALLTDTLGQYMLMAYHALSNRCDDLHRLAAQPTALGGRAGQHLQFWPRQAGLYAPFVWRPLWESLESYAAFAAFITRIRSWGLLGHDDCTAILIDP